MEFADCLPERNATEGVPYGFPRCNITYCYLTCLLLLAGAEPTETVRYLRPAGDKFVLESELRRTPDTYVSLTDRGTQKMTLTLRFGKDKALTEAEVVLQTGDKKQAAHLKLVGKRARLTRGDKTEELEVADNPIVTTAPDWSDIFLLVARYDAERGGKQEFAGLWIHPVKDTIKLTFTIERIGQDTITVKDQALKLDRYRIRLRSGDYLVWADAKRVVYKLVPAGAKATPVILEGHVDSTRELGSKE